MAPFPTLSTNLWVLARSNRSRHDIGACFRNTLARRSVTPVTSVFSFFFGFFGDVLSPVKSITSTGPWVLVFALARPLSTLLRALFAGGGVAGAVSICRFLIVVVLVAVFAL